MLDDYVQGISLQKQTGRVVANENGSWLQIEEGYRQRFRLYGEVHHIWSRNQADAAIGVAHQPAAVAEVADSSDKLILLRSEDVLFGVGVDSR